MLSLVIRDTVKFCSFQFFSFESKLDLRTIFGRLTWGIIRNPREIQEEMIFLEQFTVRVDEKENCFSLERDFVC